MNETPVANRLSIGIFGKRNAGKSSFINSLTGQNIAIVSEIPGTTTDPVAKTMEIRGLGPVIIYDTAGLDDTGELGSMRIARSKEVMRKVDTAILVTTYSTFENDELVLIDELLNSGKRVLVVFNKSDAEERVEKVEYLLKEKGVDFIFVSCKTGHNIDEARKLLIKISSDIFIEPSTILGDLIKRDDFVVLVVSIDLGAPKGRLILPQVQTIRDILDNSCIAITCKESELKYLLDNIGKKPKLVICDSQVVLKVATEVPEEIQMTTFSILFTRLKGDLAKMVTNVKAIDSLNDGDRILIMEACTHHSQADDIGRVKIPRWIKQYTGKNIHFDINAGPYVSKNLDGYKLIISCGACMINRREMTARISDALAKSIPMTNYGVAIAYVQGILARVIKPFGIFI